MEKLRIGLFAIGLDTYWPQFEGLKDRLIGYHSYINSRISDMEAEVVDAGMVDDPDKCQEAIRRFSEQRLDLLVVNISTYALSRLVLPIVKRMNVPTIILSLQPEPAIDYHFINGLKDRGKMTGEWLAYCQACVAPELGGVLTKSNIDFQLVTGHLKEEAVWAEMHDWIAAARSLKQLQNNRVGIMGHYYNGMLDVYSDLTRYASIFGSDFEIIEFGELKSEIEKVSESQIKEKIHEFERQFEVSKDCEQSELRRAARTSVGLDKIVNSYGLTSLAYYYEGAGDQAYEEVVTSLIPGFTLLTGAHIPVAGEYEIKNVHAMKIMDTLHAGGSFSEFYALDFVDDIILLGHDGPAHFSIAEGKVGLVPVPVYHGKPGKGLSIQMKVKDGPITILSVCETSESIKLLCAEGESVPGPTLQIGNTNSRYRFSLGPKEFLKQWSKAGPSHHMAVGIGHCADRLEKLSRLLNVSFQKIC